MENENTKINYILEINAFYRWLENNPLSSSAIALWHALMQQWNLSFWEEEFTPAMSVLCIRSGLSRASVQRARNELCLSGRLRCHVREKNRPPCYELICLVAQNEHIYKQNKTKLNNTKQNNTGPAVARNKDGLLVPARLANL